MLVVVVGVDVYYDDVSGGLFGKVLWFRVVFLNLGGFLVGVGGVKLLMDLFLGVVLVVLICGVNVWVFGDGVFGVF